MICGLLVTGAACILVSNKETFGRNIVEMTNYLNSFVVGPLAGLFFSGMLNRRCSARAALIAGILGMFWGLFLTFSDTFLPGTERVSFTYCIWGSCVMTIVLSALLSLIWPEKRTDELAGFVLGRPAKRD